MKPYNNHDKLSMIKSLIASNMLQQPNRFININKTSNKNFNTLNSEKNAKDKINTKLILPLQQVTIENDPEFILPIKQVTIGNNPEFIPPVCDKLSMAKLLVILKILQHPYYNENINKTFKNISPSINHENTNNTHFENLISTLPIIIAETNIDIPIESTFRLKNAALDIKSMKKDVYLTNSKLLPMHGKDDVSPSLNGKLFLEGFIRNKLDFSIARGVHDSIINLDTESVIIYIPFKCTTLTKYKVLPVFSKRKVLNYIPIYVSSACLNINNDFNEYINCDAPPINCEIKEAKIYETYTLVDKKPFSKDFPIEMEFHTIKENIIINLSLILLQKQDVTINYTTSATQKI